MRNALWMWGVLCLSLLPQGVRGQTVDQPGLVQQYDQAAVMHNAAIDVLIDLAQKSADPEFRKIIARGSDAIAAGSEALGSARVNVQAAGTTAGIYAQAVRDGRTADARAAASLWSKQATVARDHLQVWGQELSKAQTAIEAARRWLML